MHALLTSVHLSNHSFLMTRSFHRQIDVCTHIKSDRLYFIDNLLCLLSNAVKYSDRGATVDVYIEIIDEETHCISPTMTPLKNKDSVRAAGAGGFVSTMKSFDEGIVSDGITKPGSVKGDLETLLNQANISKETNERLGSQIQRVGSEGCSLEMYADAKACSKEMLALFGSSEMPNSDSLRGAKETSARMPLSDDSLRPMCTRAMLVVHVVDSGIGLSGII